MGLVQKTFNKIIWFILFEHDGDNVDRNEITDLYETVEKSTEIMSKVRIYLP